MKKIISLVLALALVATTATCAFAGTFSDVTEAYSWAEAAIETLAKDGIVSGYPDGTFLPGNSVTKQETVTLIARLAGINDATNETVVTAAKEKYGDMLSSYDTYAKDAAAYLMYKGILSETDIAQYLGNRVYNLPLARYEAAVLVAKAMGGETEVSKMVSIVPSYDDYAEIPVSAMGYVEYVKDKGVMTGMSETQFGPSSPITRAQIAVIINRVLTALNVSYLTGTVSSYDTNSRLLKIIDKEGFTNQFILKDGISYYLDGEKTAVSSIAPGETIVITLNNSQVAQIDSITVYGDESVSDVAFAGYEKNGNELKITVKDIETSVQTTYLVSEKCVVTKDGKVLTTAAELERGDSLSVEVVAGKVTVITAEAKTKEISGVVENIVLSPDYTMSVRDKDDMLHTITASSSVAVKRNGATSSLNAVLVGDSVNVTIEYNRITRITATSSKSTITGTISEITISQTPSIVITKGSQTYNLAISRDVQIIAIDGTNSDIYGLRLDQEITVTIESNTVTKVEFQAASEKTSISGSVVNVNAAYGFIDVSYVDPVTHETKLEKVFVKTGATTIIHAVDGKTKTLKDITEGSKVTASGVKKLGAFEATVVVIESLA